MSFYDKHIKGNLGPLTASLFTANPYQAGAAGAVGQAFDTPPGGSKILRSLGVGGGAAIANALVNPVAKIVASTIASSLGINAASGGGTLFTGILRDFPTGMAQMWAAEKGRGAAEHVEKLLQTKGTRTPMNTQKCTCAKCTKGDVNLDSFHKLNPEAAPKTAGWGAQIGQHANTALNALRASPAQPHLKALGTSALQAGLPSALAGGLWGGLTSPEGQGLEGAAKGALIGGAFGTGAHYGMRPPIQPKIAMFYEYGQSAAVTNFIR